MKKSKSIKSFFSNNKLSIALVVLSLSIAFFLLIFVRIESDYFWHIKAGNFMFDNGILRNDVFSWFLYSKYWMSHEWLFEIIIYSLSLLFPKYHILIYCYICIASLLLILFITNKKNYLKNIPFSMLWIILSLILMMNIQGRPHLISFNLLALTIWLLYDNYKNRESKLIYFLPLITIIWSNVHGGSSNLSYILCFVFLLTGLFKFNTSKVEAKRLSKKQIVKYIIVMILSMIAININVHGFKMFIYPYQNMMDKTMLSNISEWMPTNINNMGHLMYLIFLTFIFSIMLFSKKKISLIDLMLFGISLTLGLKSIRFWSYTYIIMSYVIFNYVEKRKIDKGTFGIIIIMSLLFISITAFNFDSIKENISKRLISKEVVSIIKEQKPKRLFNMYNYGGELIYNDILVFVDGRADLYSKYNFKDYLNISTLNDDYIQLINKYDFDYFLADNTYPINTYLKYNQDYEKIYHDKELTLYKKR